FILMGLLSVFISAVFIIKVKNYKRMLAYSSIENMGIATLAFGIGGIGMKAGFIHLIGHSLVKAAFFLTAGNIYKIFHNKQYDEVQGVIKANPQTGWLWMFAFLFLAAMPPSPLFISEFMIVLSMLKGGHFILLTIFLLLLVIIVYGLGRMAVSVSFGNSKIKVKVSPWLYLPQLGLLLFATLVGLYLLPFVQTMITSAINVL
ncbi:MAG: hydrogenase 4 subunit F, partial [Candidatus Cloacimonetes bacterium]|nr:hydrogenase 4 subunit F [Candidatus Cloacimonadota bacterium]